MSPARRVASVRATARGRRRLVWHVEYLDAGGQPLYPDPDIWFGSRERVKARADRVLARARREDEVIQVDRADS